VTSLDSCVPDWTPWSPKPPFRLETAQPIPDVRITIAVVESLMTNAPPPQPPVVRQFQKVQLVNVIEPPLTCNPPPSTLLERTSKMQFVNEFVPPDRLCVLP
jgi:hypothetical protein